MDVEQIIKDTIFMDIKQIIKDALLKKECVIEENPDTGIITVYGMDGSMWDFTVPLKLNITPKQYSYLTQLRERGIVNMFEAWIKLMEEFNLEEKEAKEKLMIWMNKFVNEDYRENI